MNSIKISGSIGICIAGVAYLAHLLTTMASVGYNLPERMLNAFVELGL